MRRDRVQREEHEKENKLHKKGKYCGKHLCVRRRSSAAANFAS
jgi:hypothetical protein